LGQFPGVLWGQAQFAMGFVGLAIESQGGDVGGAAAISVSCSLAK
jgi:hypothetical protein